MSDTSIFWSQFLEFVMITQTKNKQKTKTMRKQTQQKHAQKEPCLHKYILVTSYIPTLVHRPKTCSGSVASQYLLELVDDWPSSLQQKPRETRMAFHQHQQHQQHQHHHHHRGSKVWEQMLFDDHMNFTQGFGYAIISIIECSYAPVHVYDSTGCSHARAHIRDAELTSMYLCKFVSAARENRCS